MIIQHLKNASRKEFKAMKFYKKRWIQSGIILISSLGIVLSVFPSFADDNIDNLKGQTSALESELDGINKDILSLSEEISATEMQVEILNGEIARTSDALVEAEENENEQYENMKSRIKYMYEHGKVIQVGTAEKVCAAYYESQIGK